MPKANTLTSADVTRYGHSDCSLPSCSHSHSSDLELIEKACNKVRNTITVNSSSMFTCTQSACSQIICDPLRQMVSQNRRRYRADGFNLDLTYITDRIIAMGYPANATEAIYRNSMANTVKFLEHYHPDHYKVFNLRGQYIYDTSKFHNRVVSFEMTDHDPPRLELMAPFCREVHDYLCANPRNVVAVHCKAGKGRTGVMICAYLCYISFYRTPRQNMDYYSIIRTHNNKGVTIPSQRRYVYYFSHLREKKLNYLPLRTELIGIYLERPPKLQGRFSKVSRAALKVRITNGDVDVFDSDELWLTNEHINEEEELYRKNPLTVGEDSYDANASDDSTKKCISRRCYGWTVPSTSRVFLEGDVRLSLFQKSQLRLVNMKKNRRKVGHIWFNTMFTCPGFCGGKYIHGDEAYPVNENAIVYRVKKNNAVKYSKQSFHFEASKLCQQEDKTCIINKRQRRTRSNSSDAARKKSSIISRGSASLVSLTNNTYPPAENTSSAWCFSCNSYEKCNRSSKFECSATRRTEGHCDFMEKKDNFIIDASVEKLCDEDVIVVEPPGLEAHSPRNYLKAIYYDERQAPRYGITKILKEACRQNITPSAYSIKSRSNNLSVIPKAPLKRPNGDSYPRCLMRNDDEHVCLFNIHEIDKAHKSKDIDAEFKIFVVTKCLDESNSVDMYLANDFLESIYRRQISRDEKRQKKMESRHKKVFQIQEEEKKRSQLTAVMQSTHINDDVNVLCTQSAVRDSSSASSGTTTSSSTSSTSTSDMTTPYQYDEDPRSSNPRLQKYFFRQRVTSKSRHPSVHYHCPLRSYNRKICEKYSCRLKTTDDYQRGTPFKYTFNNIISASETSKLSNDAESDRSIGSHNNTLIDLDCSEQNATEQKFTSTAKTELVKSGRNNFKKEFFNVKSGDSLKKTSISEEIICTRLSSAEEDFIFEAFDFFYEYL